MLLLWFLCLAPSTEADQLKTLADDYYSYLVAINPIIAGQPLKVIPDTSFAFTEQKVADAKRRLQALDQIKVDQLSHADRITADLMRFQLQSTLFEQDGYYLELDLLPYSLGFLLAALPQAAAAFPFENEQDVDTYKAFLDSTTKLWRDQTAKVKAQEARGVFYPRPTLAGVQSLLNAARTATWMVLSLPDTRLAKLDEDVRAKVQKEVMAKISGEIQPALNELINYLDEDYAKRSTDKVGLSHWQGGDAYYRALIRFHTNQDLDPEDIHSQGLVYVAELSKEMAAIRQKVGFEGSQQEFHDKLRVDPRFVPQRAEDIETRFNTYVARIEPKVKDYFDMMPKAPYGVKRLDPAQEAGMTFGFYQRPSTEDPNGLYRFNGSDLPNRNMLWAAPLIYHELIPGHHFHIALQTEDTNIHPLRKIQYNTIFTEGWANYASWLAGEMGMYAVDPYDQYGWLIFNMFSSVRLVVDTGLNAKGWTLEQARTYMKENTFLSEAEIATETLRYSTDMPGQALCYKLGLEAFVAQRVKAQQALGDKFSEHRFHETALGAYAVTIPILEARVDHYIRTGEPPR